MLIFIKPFLCLKRESEPRPVLLGQRFAQFTPIDVFTLLFYIDSATSLITVRLFWSM